LEAIASSLTELFAPDTIAERMSALLSKYDFIEEKALIYFNARLTQAPRDADFALNYVKSHATTPELREAVCSALLFKMDVLWVQLDALYYSYFDPKFVPTDAFSPASN
jgi:coenzyme PQQ biosynthesis protein C